MRLKSTTDRYGAVAIAFHWISALLILILLGTGFVAAGMQDMAAKASLLTGHAIAGSIVLLLTLARIGWWLLVDRRPADPAGTPAIQAKAAHGVHLALYVLVLVMAGSGVAMLAMSGAAAILFFGAPGVLPDFTAYPPRTAHGIGAFALATLIVLHVAAALHHQLIRRDRLMARMGLG